MDPQVLYGLLVASLALLVALILSARRHSGGGYWATSWVLLLATGSVLAFEPPDLAHEIARVSATFFASLQLAGAYRYSGQRVPLWVLPVGLVAGLLRSAVAQAGSFEVSHLVVLPIEFALLGWGASVILRARPERDAVDRLLIFGALMLCGLQAADAWYDLSSPDGSVLWAAWLGPGGAVAVLQTLGVAERGRRRELEERLARDERQRMAQKLESLGVLAGGIAHDFNNFLTTILGNAEMAANELPEDHPAAESVEACIEGALHAARLSQQMLAYAAGQGLRPEPVDLTALIRSNELLLRTAVGADVSLEVRAARDLPRVMGDATQLDQVVMNLAINASEAYSDSGGTVRIDLDRVEHLGDEQALTIGSLGRGTHARLRVGDDGNGFDEETAAKVFDPFFSGRFPGRGLGLAIVQRIVADHGGAIDVTSAPRTGSRFDVYLPATQAEPKKTLPAPGPASRVEGRILVVDDDPQVLRVARISLEAAGHEVAAAGGGEEALAILAKLGEQFSLVLLDATMPGVGSREVLASIRRTRPDLPVLVMTGHDPLRIARAFAEHGGLSLIRKPFSREALLDSVAERLQRPRS